MSEILCHVPDNVTIVNIKETPLRHQRQAGRGDALLKTRPPSIVMAGLVPAIHVFAFGRVVKTWMPATSAGVTGLDSQNRHRRLWGPLTLSREAGLAKTVAPPE